MSDNDEIEMASELFSDLVVGGRALLPQTLDYLQRKCFLRPSPVQAVVIPAFLGNSDVAVEACTGSGKSLAYLIPVVERLYLRLVNLTESPFPFNDHTSLLNVGGLILAPTRELVQQIHSVLSDYLKEFTVSVNGYQLGCLELYGGRKSSVDKLIVNRMDNNTVKTYAILTTTPGRLSGHLNGSHDHVLILNQDLTFKALEVLVIDEADRIITGATQHDQLKVCLANIPKQRRTGLFSATLTSEINSFMKIGLRSPLLCKVDLEDCTAHSLPTMLNNYALYSPMNARVPILMKLLSGRRFNRIIIFLTCCKSVDFLVGVLKKHCDDLGKFYKLHGKVDKGRRNACIRDFNSDCDVPQILLTSDLGARGLDFKAVDLIVQLEPPSDYAEVVHRLGRTARAGRSGTTLTFLSDNEDAFVPFLEAQGVRLKFVENNEECSAVFGFDEKSTVAIKNRSEISSKARDHGILWVRKENDHYLPVSIEEVKDLVCELRQWSLNDRMHLDFGTECFVTHVRGYSEHKLKHIFVFESMDMVALAHCYGLFKIPFMSKLNNTTTKQFHTIRIEPDEYGFINDADQAKWAEKELLRAKVRKGEIDRRTARNKQAAEIAAAKKTRTGKARVKRHLAEAELRELMAEEKAIKRAKKRGEEDEDLDFINML